MKKTQDALNEVAAFIVSQETRAIELGKSDCWARDQEVLKNLAQRLAAGDADDLNHAKDELRGFSHYLGSYCSDLPRLDELLDRLYESLREDILRARSR